MNLKFLHEVNLSSASTISPPKSAVAEPPELVVIRESDLVVIFATLLCAAISVAGLIVVVRCAWMRHSTSGGRRSSASSNKGLKKKVVQSLPKFTYDMEAIGNDKMCASTECAVCLSEYIDGDEIRVMPQCGHGFHVGCIDTWLGSHSSCPSCRQVLVVNRCRKCGDR